MNFKCWSLFFFVCLIAGATIALDPCYFLPGSVYANGKCFLLLPDPGIFVTAKDKCAQGRHAVVAEIRSQDEKEALLSIVPPNIWVFIGLTDIIKEGDYVWNSDGKRLNRSLTPWEITCLPPAIPEFGDCVILMSNGTLACMDCNWPYFIVCQLAVGNPCDLFLPGAEYHNGGCFLYVEDGSGVDGQVFCEEKGAFLVEPKTDELMKYIKNISNRYTEGLRGKDYQVRIGGVALQPGNWTWLTSGEEISFRPWSSGEPNELDTETDIVMVKGDSWNWNNVQSHANEAFICQRDVGDPCEEDLPGGIFILGSCFKYFDKRMSWQSAKSACIDQGGFLAEPKTKQLSDALMNYYLHVVGNSGDFVWLGGTRDPHVKWRWTTSGVAVEDIAWHASEPNNASGSLGPENVMVLSPKGSKLGWNDISENNSWGCVCQKVPSPRRHQSYLAVLPSPDESTSEDVVGYVTSGFESHLVYLKLTTSCGRIARTSVSYSKHLEFIPQKEERCVNSTDARPEYVLIEASDSVTVVIAMKSTMTLIYPSSWALGRPQGLSYIVNSDPRGNYCSSSLTVATLTNGSNDLTLYLTKGTQNVNLDVNQVTMNLRYPASISVEMKQTFLTLPFSVLSASGGLFVDSVHPVVAFLDYRKAGVRKGETCLSYNQILPVHLLGHEYVSFPGLPLEAGRRTMLKVVAVRDDTHIMVYGTKASSSVQEIRLPFAGDAKTVSLANDEFYFVNSSEVFYAMLLFENSGVQLQLSCMTPLLPTNLWRNQYDFTTEFAANLLEAAIFVVVVLDNRLRATLEIIPSNDNWDCTDIPGTNWSGCYRQLVMDYSTTYYHVYLQNHTARFAAYLLSSNKKTSVCYPLGVSTKPPLTNNFDKDVFLQTLEDPNPCSCTSTTSLDPLDANSFTTTTDGFREPSTAQTSQEVVQTTQEGTARTSSDSTAETPATTSTSTTTAVAATTTTTTTTAAATTTTTTAAATTITTAAITSPPTTNGALTTGHESTTVYNEATFKRELAKLHIDRKDTLSYKKSKFSIQDVRLSAAAIGVVGVTSVVAAISVVVASDVLNFCRNAAKYGCNRTVHFNK